MEDWANLFEHALNADAAPAFQHWLHHRSGWQWQGSAEQADHPEEPLVRCCCLQSAHGVNIATQALGFIHMEC